MFNIEPYIERARKIKPVPDNIATGPWMQHVKNFKEYFIQNGIKNFLRTPLIIGTMFVGNGNIVEQEYKYLVENVNWHDVWRDAIKESTFNVGNPLRFPWNCETSGNKIHCAYHLAQFEERMNYRIKDMDSILEIGAGYGCMADVCYGAGFKGEYILFDLPLFNLLQDAYLNAIGRTHNKISFVDDIQKLLTRPVNGKSMVISTWALSEMPESYRDKLIIHCLKFKHILLAYQYGFEKMDIIKYFKCFKRKHTEYSWQNYDIKILNNEHKYLFGSNFYE